MNETTSSAPGASLLPDSTGMFTAAHLVLIAVLMVLVVIGLVIGARRASLRRTALHELEEHNQEVAQHTPAADDAPARPDADEAPPPTPPRERAYAATELLLPTPGEPSPLPTAQAPPAVAEPTAAKPPSPAPIGDSPADGPVTQLKGLGPKLATRLGELGITTVGQLAALTDDEAQALDARLGSFTGRMGRDRWQEQARFLAAGDQAGFEAVFGRL